MGLNDNTGRPAYQTFANQGTNLDTKEYQRIRAAQYDVTASRALGTTYQNTSGRVKMVTVTLRQNTQASGGGSTCASVAYVQNSTPADDTSVGELVTSTVPLVQEHAITFVVPVGFYYRMSDEDSDGGGATTLIKWFEWEIF